MNYTELEHRTARSDNSRGEPVTRGYHPIEFTDTINAGNSAVGNRAFMQIVGSLYRQRQLMLGGATNAPAGPVSDDAPVQMMLGKDKLDYLVKFISDKKELPRYWHVIARRLYGVELDDEDIAYITAGVQPAQPTPASPVHKAQGVEQRQEEAATGGVSAMKILSEKDFELFTGWILKNDIRALFFGDYHGNPDTMLPVEVVKTLAGRGILHSVMMEFAVNKDDAETEKIQEDYINHKRIRDAKTLQDIKIKQDPGNCSWHFAQIIHVLYQKGIPWVYFGSPNHQYTRETLKKGLSQVPPGKVILIMIGSHHLYPPEIVGDSHHDIPPSAYGLLSQRAKGEYGVNISGFNGAWVENEWQFGGGYMKNQIVYRARLASEAITRQDQFYEKVLFPNIKYMSDTEVSFNNTGRFKRRIY